jgi:hypothetical protein
VQWLDELDLEICPFLRFRCNLWGFLIHEWMLRVCPEYSWSYRRLRTSLNEKDSTWKTSSGVIEWINQSLDLEIWPQMRVVAGCCICGILHPHWAFRWPCLAIAGFFNRSIINLRNKFGYDRATRSCDLTEYRFCYSCRWLTPHAWVLRVSSVYSWPYRWWRFSPAGEC